MFRPDPKPEKKQKQPKRITKVSKAKKYLCSDGSKVSQSYINTKLTQTYAKVDYLRDSSRCDAYHHLNWNDHDHTIAQRRCKELGKTELIWDIDNIAYSSRTAHNEWERIKSGLWEDHYNCIDRMKYVAIHDPETFEKRMAAMSDYIKMKFLREYETTNIHEKRKRR